MEKENFVTLWHGEILPKNNVSQDFLPLLNEYEKNKASTYTRLDLRQKYINTRGILRLILASYLDCNPQQIPIEKGEYGKPYIPEQLEKSVHFNVSHTGNKLVIVVSNCSEVGVDIEQCKNRKSLPGLVEKCFSDKEANYWNTLPEEQKVNMFFRFWVRKEAFVKTVGRGIGLGLNQCSIHPEKQDRFTNIPQCYGFSSNWRIIDVPLGSLNVCAVVTKNMKFNFTQAKWRRS
ncbi:MAG: 4'-phosphopantetheinyl transferase superfamily protein [Methylococcaceae bacterium]|nr:4'-phosphopantetheinyl transferase superfamily protein [Methylococcaceae bacterium]